jgi:hypothetical protein
METMVFIIVNVKYMFHGNLENHPTEKVAAW